MLPKDNKIKTRIIQAILEKRRHYRLNFCLKKLDYSTKSKILDVGCGPDGRSLEVFLKENPIVGIDRFPIEELKMKQSNFIYTQGTAEDLSYFEDNQFDIAFCIGMMEHKGKKNERKKICEEIKRVSKQYAIIVPWKYALIEPHFKLPFFAICPYKLQIKLILRFNLNGMRGWMREEGNSVFEENYQWLSKKEWKKFFPYSRVYPIFFGVYWDALVIIGPFY